SMASPDDPLLSRESESQENRGSLASRGLEMPGKKSRRAFGRLAVASTLAATVVLAVWLHGNRRRFAAPRPPIIELQGVALAVAAAIQRARARVDQHPLEGPAWGRLGQILRAHEFYVEADLCFDRACELDPKNPRWPYLIARGPRCTNS